MTRSFLCCSICMKLLFVALPLAAKVWLLALVAHVVVVSADDEEEEEEEEEEEATTAAAPVTPS
jgi:hypothetical protein